MPDRYTDSEQTPHDLIPIGEAARILGVSVDTLRRWDREERIASVRTLGGQRRFRRADVTDAAAGAGAA